jgi:hypothetical protein
MKRAQNVLADFEVVELLADEPELLAIADAVAATQPRQSGRRRRPRLTALVAAAVAVAAALALVPNRGDNRPLLADALAAIGSGPVVHARIETRLPETRVVELATGRAVQQTISIEYWFDEPRARLATVVRRGGLPFERFLATLSGTVSGGGPVRTTGRSTPALDPALAGFVTRYREALESGAARVVGRGKLGGRAVVWLQLGAGATRERVAVDAETFTPISVVPLDEQGRPTAISWRVRVIETVARVEANFSVPQPRAPRPYRGDVARSQPLSSAQVSQAVGWPALWLGQSWNGLRLSSLELQRLTRGYPPGSGETNTSGRGLRLRYEVDGGARSVEITQAPFPEPAYAFAGGEATFNGNPIPREGFVEIVELGGAAQGGSTRVVGQLRQEGVYLTIWASSRELCLAAARALTRIST